MFLDANIFQPLIDVFAAVIKFFHDNVGISWGWSIVLLTVCVRLVMMPLTVRQFHSMKRLQEHQPQMKAIQKRYKDDKQRQQQELMKFYQENGINPLASCLPLVAQLPVFISLFYMLKSQLRNDICRGVQLKYQAHYAVNYAATNHVSLAAAKTVALGQTTPCGPGHPQASFLFINDITAQATGITLIILLIMYVGTQMASTLLMSQPTMDKNQRRMMALLPLLFVVFIFRFPAGLLVYWITTNTWTMSQQYVLKKIIGAPMIPEVIDADEPGSKGGLAAAQAASPGRFASLFTPRPNRPPASTSNGASAKKVGAAEPVAASKTSGNATPPPPPRKKKKRSGRRR